MFAKWNENAGSMLGVVGAFLLVYVIGIVAMNVFAVKTQAPNESRLESLETKQKELYQRIADLETAKTGIVKIRPKDNEDFTIQKVK